MDRTADDLLQQISNLTSPLTNSISPAINSADKPIDDAFIASLLEAAAQIEPEAVDSLVEEFGAEFSPEELLSAAQALIGEENLSVDAGHATDETSKFAKDPYVAETDELQAFTAVPKSIEEILETISGYQAEDEADHNLDPKSELEPTTDSSILDNPTDKLELANSTDELPGQSGEIAVESLDEITQPEFNVSAFADAEEIVEGTPAPIRGAYEVDRELFDYQVVERPDPYADISQTGEDQTEPETDSVNAMEITADEATEQDDNYFWANTGDVITIDGNQGYGHIDLACFDVSDATFRGNQIQIACDDGTSFLIEHCNVTYAIFADGVEIELTTEEPDSDQA